jgi:hypothetical protein
MKHNGTDHDLRRCKVGDLGSPISIKEDVGAFEIAMD